MAVVVAEGVVDVTADATKVPGKVKSDVEGGSSTTEAAGKSLGTGLFKGFGSIVLGAVTTIGTTIGGLALAGGFNRALGIQEAQQKLKGLGHDTTAIAGIMSSALASVKGTAYGLNDAATVAASLVASGVEQGDYLTGVLKTVADTAAISGRSLTDVGVIFGSVAARGKLQGDDLLQLMSAGVPVLQLLSKQLGISSADVSEMVSKGQVDFATFAAAMEAGLGGSALASGETARGAFANVRAALSRLGLIFAEPLVAGAPALFQSLAAMTDRFGAALAPIAESVGPKIAGFMETVGGWMDKLDFSGMSGALEGFGAIAPILAGVLVPAMGNFLSTLGPIGRLIPTISGPIGLIIGLIGSLLVMSPELRSALGGAFQTVLGTLQQVGTTLAPVFAQLMPLLGTVVQMIAGALADAITGLMPTFTTLIDFFGQLVAQLLPAIMPLLTTVAELFASLLPALVPVINALVTGLLPVVSMVVPLFAQLIEALTPIIGALLPPLMALIEALVPILTPLIDAFVQLLEPVLGLLTPLFALIGDILPPLIALLTPIIELVGGLLAEAFKIVAPFIAAVGDVLGVVLAPVIELVHNLLKGIIEFITAVFQGRWEDAWNAIVGIFVDLWNGLGGVVKGVLNGIIGLVNGAIDLINGLIGGINGVTGAIGIPAIPLIPHIPMLAKGTNDAPDMFIAGENGPELITGAKGATVRPYDVTRDLLMGGTGTTVTIGEVTLDARNVDDFMRIVELIKALPQVARTGRPKGVTP